MKRGITRTGLALLALMAAATLRGAPELSPLPAHLAALAPQPLLPHDLAGSMRFRDAAATAAPSTATWENAPGSRALRIETAGMRTNPSEVNVSWRLVQAVNRGDVCLARFYARTIQRARNRASRCLISRSSPSRPVTAV